MKNKLVVLMPDGVGIRNYIYSGVLKDIGERITLLHNFKTNTLKDISVLNLFNTEKLIQYKETPKEKFLREIIHLVRLRYNADLKNNSSILNNYMPKENTLKLKLFYLAVEFYAKFYNSINKIERLEKKYNRTLRQSRVYNFYFDYFNNNSVSSIFCTHQRSIIAAPIFAAAKDLGIETVTAIYSWDNLPKARLALRADKYIVWSPYMKNELKIFYPEINNHQIEILGTPQFQFHFDKSYLWSKEKFAEFYNLDLNKKWLCFSGDDKTTSPFDPEYLRDIAKQISNSDLSQDWLILLRPVPVEGFDKYQKVIDNYPELIKKTGADWQLSSHWSDVFPKQNDLNILTSLCEYADAVINVGSTMALDFGMHNKPAIYINYQVTQSENWSIELIYKFQHFRTMQDLNPIIWLNSPQQLINILKNLNYYHEKTKFDMEKWCNVIIPEYLRKESSQLIKNTLIK